MNELPATPEREFSIWTTFNVKEIPDGFLRPNGPLSKVFDTDKNGPYKITIYVEKNG